VLERNGALSGLRVPPKKAKTKTQIRAAMFFLTYRRITQLFSAATSELLLEEQIRTSYNNSTVCNKCILICVLKRSQKSNLSTSRMGMPHY
jgi:hypothetical protein